jgi:ketosteroid isomerase-like protein
MKKVFAIILLLSGLNIFSFAQTEKLKFNKQEKQVLQVINQWRDAMLVRDMNTLDKIFSDDVIITTFDGSTRGKKEELEAVKPNPDLKTLSIGNKYIRIKVYGQTAVVTALTEMQSSFRGRKMDIFFRFTSVFAKKKGRWRMVALQTTRINLKK